jgi:outer membrane protein assembly factor BamB
MANRIAAGVVVFVVAASLTVSGGAARAASCAPAGHAAGEWRSYGQNLSNSRQQALETQISPANVAGLEPAWALTPEPTGGNLWSTPVIADGCLYITSSNGTIVAANADTGEVVWRSILPSGFGIMAPSVADGRVHVLVAQAFAPYAAALDQATGSILWLTPLVDQHTGFINASAVVSDGLMFAAVAGRDLLDPFSRPAFFILDAATGEILKKTRVIPDSDAFAGTPPSPVGGGGIWTTAAVDTQTKYLYAGTANPYSKKLEHERTNSLLKIDFDRSRPTFGEIVANYKGDFDYVPANYDSPECQTLGDAQPVGYSIFCGQQDVDFGASPNLFTSSDGRVLVGDLQKSGTYHALDAATMTPVWTTRNLASPAAAGNAASPAFDETSIYVAPNDGKVYALDKDTGAIRWTATYPNDGSHYQPVTVANSVVYTLGNFGNVRAYDAATGALLLDEAPAVPGLACHATAGAGIAVARNTVYVACDSAAPEGSGLPSVLDGFLTGPQPGAVFAMRL